MENRYSNYLPDTVRELQEFQKLSEIEGPALEEAAAAKDALVRNQWILTAEREGLLRLANMMGFLGAEVLGTEELREEVLFRWNSRSPYTVFHLQDWLDACLGADAYQLTLERECYRMRLILELWVKEKREFLEKYLRKIIPANLQLEVDLNVNTYGALKALTHGQMKELRLTYDGLRYEDLSEYKK